MLIAGSSADHYCRESVVWVLDSEANRSGADACYSARSIVMALGCIQALKCNSNHYPFEVATQDKQLEAGLVPSDKKVRVESYS